jgi:hypothetical protein
MWRKIYFFIVKFREKFGIDQPSQAGELESRDNTACASVAVETTHTHQPRCNYPQDPTSFPAYRATPSHPGLNFPGCGGAWSLAMGSSAPDPGSATPERNRPSSVSRDRAPATPERNRLSSVSRNRASPSPAMPPPMLEWQACTQARRCGGQWGTLYPPRIRIRMARWD